MNKTIKMSSFLLMLGLGCMLLYVILNIFNIPIREGLKDKKKKDEIGLTDEEKEKNEERATAEVKEVKSLIDFMEKNFNANAKSNPEHFKQVYNDKSVPHIINMLTMMKGFYFKEAPRKIYQEFKNGQLTEKGKKIIDTIEYFDKAIEILDTAGREGGGNSAAQAAIAF